VHGKATSIPGKALAGVISLLKADLPAERFKQLNDFHSMVVDRLRLQNSEEQDPSLGKLLLAVKAMAGIRSDQEQTEEGPAEAASS